MPLSSVNVIKQFQFHKFLSEFEGNNFLLMSTIQAPIHTPKISIAKRLQFGRGPDLSYQSEPTLMLLLMGQGELTIPKKVFAFTI